VVSVLIYHEKIFFAGLMCHFYDTELWSSEQQFNTLTLRLLMSYIYGAHILDVSRSHTTTQHSR